MNRTTSPSRISLPKIALTLAAVLVSSLTLADTVKEIRIAVPDISAGPIS
ncbi:hypothetical protein PHLH6_27840 [Pseudomonas sp. Seg1]|nr:MULTISPECIES: hypothetical protein [unclassified Pseudomonas]BBP70780.1 hypothetical protein PHLH6_27840 [Pseudomonas sp. Seg1]